MQRFRKAAHHKSLQRQMLRDGRRRHRERVPPFEHSLRNRARNFRQGRRVIERRLSHLRSPSSTSLRRTCDPRNLEPRIKRVRSIKKAGRALSASGLFVHNQGSLTSAASIKGERLDERKRFYDFFRSGISPWRYASSKRSKSATCALSFAPVSVSATSVRTPTRSTTRREE